MTKRSVILHFHLFKNAGTSVDTILKNNFGEKWIEIEGPGGKKLTPEALADFIHANPQYDAISSHTAIVSMPPVEDINIIPIFFFRHPIDRIRSAYDFERKQDAQTPGAIKAKEGDFEYYMNWRLSTPNPWQVSEFHSFRLKDFHEFTPAKRKELFLPRAKKAIEALPHVGLVEHFDESILRLERSIRLFFPEFKAESVHANVTADRTLKLSENVERFKERIGSDVFTELMNANTIDLELYEVVKTRFHAEKEP